MSVKMPRDGNLRHPEGDVAAVAHDLRADLDEFLLQACQRPVCRELPPAPNKIAALWELNRRLGANFFFAFPAVLAFGNPLL
jgi:hypothetical protein